MNYEEPLFDPRPKRGEAPIENEDPPFRIWPMPIHFESLEAEALRADMDILDELPKSESSRRPAEHVDETSAT